MLAKCMRCLQNASMNITIRNVPQEVRDALADNAARQGKSMQEYLRAELMKLSRKMSTEEWVARVSEMKARYNTSVSIEEILEARNRE